jgi:YbbR domain-containing protein
MLVFSFFLAISVIIWLLNALSKNYTTDIKYPITYSKFPENKILVSDVPDHLELKVNAHGYALLSYKLTNRPIPLSFPVTSFNMNTMNGDTSRLFLLTRYAREQVARQLPSELQLLEISPDSLIFRFANEVSRKIPVQPVIGFKPARNFTLKAGVRIQPDSVRVTGPDIFVDTMQAVPTKLIELGTLEKSYNGMLQLRAFPRIRYSSDKVECTIELEKMTEVQVMVPVQISGLPDSLLMQTFPQEVRVTGRIGLSRYERIVPEAFWAGVDFQEARENKQRLQVQLRTVPNDLSGVSFYPQTVEYLISVK